MTPMEMSVKVSSNEVLSGIAEGDIVTLYFELRRDGWWNLFRVEKEADL